MQVAARHITHTKPLSIDMFFSTLFGAFFRSVGNKQHSAAQQGTARPARNSPCNTSTSDVAGLLKFVRFHTPQLLLLLLLLLHPPPRFPAVHHPYYYYTPQSPYQPPPNSIDTDAIMVEVHAATAGQASSAQHAWQRQFSLPLLMNRQYIQIPGVI